MKKLCLLLALTLSLSCLAACAPGQDSSECREAPETPEKPAIYLYPEDSITDEKPAIYLYPEDSTTYGKPAIYLYPEDSAHEPQAPAAAEKPAVYLYPENAAKIQVKLDFSGSLTCTYPEYKNGWTVWATPDGILTDESGRQYNYLFWEGTCDADYDMSKGFVVSGGDTAEFLEKTLKELGLNDREAGDFITYWLPRMQGNPYNLITFQQEAYTETAKLTISPEPDSLLRVFMVFQPLDAPIDLPQPELPGFQRKGFTAVEWGGAELTHS